MGGPTSGQRIDWAFEVRCYNQANGTAYADKDILLRDLYCELKSAKKVETKIGGPNWVTIIKCLRAAGVTIQPRGGPNNKGMKFPDRRRTPRI